MTGSCIFYIRTDKRSSCQFNEQMALLDEFAGEKGYTVLQIFSDYGVSSKKIFGRKELNEAMNYVNETPEVTALVVKSIDCLTRSLSDYLVIRDYLKERNVKLLVLDQPNINEGVEDSLVRSIIASLNKF